MQVKRAHHQAEKKETQNPSKFYRQKNKENQQFGTFWCKEGAGREKKA